MRNPVGMMKAAPDFEFMQSGGSAGDSRNGRHGFLQVGAYPSRRKNASITHDARILRSTLLENQLAAHGLTIGGASGGS